MSNSDWPCASESTIDIRLYHAALERIKELETALEYKPTPDGKRLGLSQHYYPGQTWELTQANFNAVVADVERLIKENEELKDALGYYACLRTRGSLARKVLERKSK